MTFDEALARVRARLPVEDSDVDDLTPGQAATLAKWRKVYVRPWSQDSAPAGWPVPD